jgi:hypothetical protein
MRCPAERWPPGSARAGGDPAVARPSCPDARDATRFTTLLEHTADLGDIALTGNLDAGDSHWRGRRRTAPAGTFVIILGGGHETSRAFPRVRQCAPAGRYPQLGLACDARPLQDRLSTPAHRFAGSQALSGALRRYCVAGLQRLGCRGAPRPAESGRAVFRDEVTPTVMRELYADSAVRLVH